MFKFRTICFDKFLKIKFTTKFHDFQRFFVVIHIFTLQKYVIIFIRLLVNFWSSEFKENFTFSLMSRDKIDRRANFHFKMITRTAPRDL